MSLPKLKKILIVRKQAIGDVLLTTPMIEVLRRHYPTAHLTYLTNDWSQAAIKDNPNIDELIVYENDEFFNLLKFWKQPLKKIRHIYQIKRKNFDTLIVLQSPHQTWGLFGKFINAKTRIAFSSGKKDWLTHRVVLKTRPNPFQAYIYDDRNKVEWNLDLLRKLGIKNTQNNGLYLKINQGSKNLAKEFWQNNNLNNYKIIALALGGGTNPNMKQFVKRWSSYHWTNFIKLLYKNYGRQIKLLLIGGKSDTNITNKILKSLPMDIKSSDFILDQVGRLPLDGTVAFLKKSFLFVGSDGGPMHLAVCAKIPIISIWGSTDPSVYGPYYGSSSTISQPVILDQKLPCGYCYKEECAHISCMKLITPRIVLNQIKKKLR